MTGWRSSGPPMTNLRRYPCGALLQRDGQSERQGQVALPLTWRARCCGPSCNDTRYPATLLNGVTLRIRAEREVTRGRAAILKAYYLKNCTRKSRCTEGGLDQCLSTPTAPMSPTLWGGSSLYWRPSRQSANPGINATIKDKYFNSAAATPAVIFPVLINLAQKASEKAGDPTGLRIYL